VLAALVVGASGCSGAGSNTAGPAPGTTIDGPPTGGAASGPSTTTVPGTVTTVAAPIAPGPPGQLIAATPIESPSHTRAWNIVYHSRSVDDRDIAVTGALITPDEPAQDLPIITWGHPTTGTADLCTPSAQGTTSLPLPELITGNGIAVVATDYEGLGTADPHPYLVGASEAHTMLDAVRAAREVTGSGVTQRSPTIIWGFSQGGHAAGFAAQLAPTYAPDLDVRGAAIAAPVSDVDHFARRAEDRADQFGVLVTIVGSYAHAYPDLDPSTVFTTEVVGQLTELERLCIGDINIFFNRSLPDMLAAKPSGRTEFAARFAENQLGNTSIPVPVLVVQGAKDDIVDPADTQALVDRWCARGVDVQYVVKPDSRHGVLGDEPYFDWIQDRLRGEPTASTCPGPDGA
jgi:pimeloyl-ACP methyl ester carboxylesterase